MDVKRYINKKTTVRMITSQMDCFAKNVKSGLLKTSVSKLHFDKTRYKLTFSLRDVSKRGRDEILSMCGEHLKQRLLSKENISITNNAEAIYGIIQRLKGVDVAYEVKPPYPFEVKAWDGYMDRDFCRNWQNLTPN